MFIELTTDEGKQLFNLDAIGAVSKADDGAILHTRSGKPITVRENYAAVRSLIVGKVYTPYEIEAIRIEAGVAAVKLYQQ